MKLMKTLVLAAGASLILAAAASAHVTLNPGMLPPTASAGSPCAFPRRGRERPHREAERSAAGGRRGGQRPAEAGLDADAVNGRVVTWSGGETSRDGEFDEFAVSASTGAEHARRDPHLPGDRDVRERQGRALDRRGARAPGRRSRGDHAREGSGQRRLGLRAQRRGRGGRTDRQGRGAAARRDAECEASPARGWQPTMAGRVITWTGGRVPQGESGEFDDHGPVPEHTGRTAAVSDRSDLRQRDGRPLDRRPVLGHACSDHPPDRGRPASASTSPPPPPPPPPPRPPRRATSQDEDDGSTGWLVGAVIIVVLVGAGAALLWRRRR